MEIVRARAGDAGNLTRIAFTARRYWGYPERWIEGWREALTITLELVRRNEVHAAIVDKEPAGFYALAGESEVEHLRVLPKFIGVGSARSVTEP